MEHSLKTGSLLKDRYNIKKVIYKGRFYNFYIAEDAESKGATLWITEFHLKKLPPARRNTTEDQFLELVDLLKALSHPVLPSVLGGFYHEDSAYLIVTNREGLSIEQYLSMAVSPFTVEDALKWTLKMNDALEYLYNRPVPLPFCHLDAPHILLDDKGTVSLMGFGLHIFLDHYFSSTDPNAFCAPEIAEGKSFSVQSAIYSLGALLYYMITKQKFDISRKDNPRICEIINNMPPGLDGVVEKALAKDPAQRYIDLETFSRKLREVITPAPPPPPAQKEPEKPQKEGTLQRETNRLVKRFVKVALIIGAVIAVIAAPFLIKSIIKNKMPPDADFAYVLDEEKSRVLIFNIKSGNTQGVISFLGTTESMGLSPDGERVFIARREKNILIADAKNGSPIGTYPLDDEPSNLLVAPPGPYLYITGRGSPALTVWDSNSLVIDTLVKSGVIYNRLAAAGNGSIVIAAGNENNEIAVIDTGKKEIVASFSSSEHVEELATNKDGTLLIVLSHDKKAVFYNTTSRSTAGEIILEKGVKHPASSCGKDAPDCFYVAAESDRSISRLDCTSFSISKKAVTRGIPRALAVSRGGKVLYVATVSPESLLLYDSLTLSLINEYPLPFKPTSLFVY